MFLVYFLNVCMNALTVHISVHRLVPVEARWFQIPGMELQTILVGAENGTLGPVEEQPAVLITEPSFQPKRQDFYMAHR